MPFEIWVWGCFGGFDVQSRNASLTCSPKSDCTAGTGILVEIWVGYLALLLLLLLCLEMQGKLLSLVGWEKRFHTGLGQSLQWKFIPKVNHTKVNKQYHDSRAQTCWSHVGS